MKDKYQKPLITIIVRQADDVIRTSGGNGDTVNDVEWQNPTWFNIE